MEIVTIKKEKFDNLAKCFSCKNFFQTSMMGNVLEKRGKKVYYLALKNGNQYEGVCLLSENGTFLGKKSYQCLKGFLTDFNKEEVVLEFGKKLADFVFKNNGYKLTIDPYLMEVQRDIDGNIVSGGVNNYKVIETLRKGNFIKSKIDIQVRNNFCLDFQGLNEDEIFKNFKASTRNIISKAIREGVEVFDLKYEELEDFKKITEYTCKRRGFSDKTLDYYKSMYNEFGSNVVFKMARLNVNNYIEGLQNLKNDYQKKAEKINNSKKKENYLFEIENIEKKLKKIENVGKNKDYIDLACGMFMLYGDETIYLFSGSYEEYMEFGGQYLIQWEIIKYGIKNGYKRHNFFGIINYVDKNDKDYGIYLFKRGFNGYVEQLIGEYYVTTGLVGFLYKIKEKIR